MKKIKNTCPFCGKTVKRLIEECNGFCECGAKYCFQDKIWLERNTGEKIKEERLYKIIYETSFEVRSIIIGAKNATEALEVFYTEVMCFNVKSIEEYEMGENVVAIPKTGIGDLSDGYHTFNELYHHRAVLFSVICNLMPDKAWKSKLHDTGDMFEGMFIVGIKTPDGQATYHYDIEPYWDMFKVKELERAPKWDGHTPQEAIERIKLL